MWAETKQQHWDPPVTLIIPLLLHEWVCRVFPCHVTKPWSAKAPSLCFWADLSHILTPSLSWGADLLLHTPFLSRDWQSSRSSVLFFWAVLFMCFLFLVSKSSSTHFWRRVAVPRLMWDCSEAMGTAAGQLLHGRETSPGLQGPWPYSHFRVLFGTGLVSVTCAAAGSSKAPEESWLAIILDMWLGFFFSAVWLMVTSLLWNLKWIVMEWAKLLKINFYKEFSGLKWSERCCSTEWDCWVVTELGCEQAGLGHSCHPQGWNVTSSAHQGTTVSGGDDSEEPRAGLWYFNLVFSKE